jgi:hypothetical protein
MRYDPNDAEVRAFVMNCPETSWSVIAKLCELRFQRRAWPVSLIKTVRHRVETQRGGSPFARDADVMHLISERHGLVTQVALLAEGRALFGKRFPSKSALGRLIARVRLEALLEARAATGQENP